jgi:UDP-N-acetylmuramate--alanine ligase
MLAELVRLKYSVAVAGTHGKTTTTSLVATLLDAGGVDPTVMNGGVINAYGANAKAGQGDWVVVEADESDGTFLYLKPTIAVVTNIDPEHLDHWGDFEAVKKAFQEFVESIPFYGRAVVCLDHPEVQSMAARVENRRIVTYGTNPQAEVRALNIEMGPDGASFDVLISPVEGEQVRFEQLKTPIAGLHNVLNALAAIAVARELGLGEDAIRQGLAGFSGVRRRFTTTGVVDGVRIIDDYGHHPVEISAVLRAARAMTQGKVIAVVQPHRYSRLHDLFDEFCGCFNNADTVIVAEVYPAGEAPIEGASRDALVEGLRRAGHRHVLPLAGPAVLADVVALEARPGDLVVCLGAGDITQWAYALPDALKALGK